MAIIKNSTPFDSIKRKFSITDEIHFRTRKADNATIGVRVKHPYNGGGTAAQQEIRTAFAAAQTKVKELMGDPTQRAQYEKQFKAQKKCLTLRGFIFSQVYRSAASV